ncbi:TPA: hypothetical protein WGS02_001681, partial [Neisseria meningitidis]
TNSTARRGNAVLVFVNPLYVVEQSFGTLHRKFRYARAAYFGLICARCRLKGSPDA